MKYLVSEPDFFSPHDLYPCSHQCSFQRQPCPSCLNPRPPSSIPSSPQPSSSTSQSSPSVDCLLPRRPLRSAYSHFLKSIREHLIHQISETATNSEQKSATRLGDGFLLQPSYNHSEWGVGWDHHSTNRFVFIFPPLLAIILIYRLVHSFIANWKSICPQHVSRSIRFFGLPTSFPFKSLIQPTQECQ